MLMLIYIFIDQNIDLLKHVQCLENIKQINRSLQIFYLQSYSDHSHLTFFFNFRTTTMRTHRSNKKKDSIKLTL